MSDYPHPYGWTETTHRDPLTGRVLGVTRHPVTHEPQFEPADPTPPLGTDGGHDA